MTNPIPFATMWDLKASSNLPENPTPRDILEDMIHRSAAVDKQRNEELQAELSQIRKRLEYYLLYHTINPATSSYIYITHLGVRYARDNMFHDSHIIKDVYLKGYKCLSRIFAYCPFHDNGVDLWCPVHVESGLRVTHVLTLIPTINNLIPRMLAVLDVVSELVSAQYSKIKSTSHIMRDIYLCKVPHSTVPNVHMLLDGGCKREDCYSWLVRNAIDLIAAAQPWSNK